jgi:hypothetical protein
MHGFDLKRETESSGRREKKIDRMNKMNRIKRRSKLH